MFNIGCDLFYTYLERKRIQLDKQCRFFFLVGVHVIVQCSLLFSAVMDAHERGNKLIFFSQLSSSSSSFEIANAKCHWLINFFRGRKETGRVKRGRRNQKPRIVSLNRGSGRRQDRPSLTPMSPLIWPPRCPSLCTVFGMIG